ncbi:MAG: hypothetical protein ABII64_08220 [Elusimicrobiota bacterium]
MKKIFLLIFSLLLVSPLFAANVFTVDKDFIYLNGKKFIIKGVNYGFAYPGEMEWEYYSVKPFPKDVADRIIKDIKDIKSINMNTIRIWEPLAVVCEQAKKNGLYIYYTLWWEMGADNFYTPGFLEKQKGFFRNYIDKLHNLNGVDYSDIVISYALGNEIPEKCVKNNDKLNAGIDEYKGEYISALKGSTPTECFLAQLGDYVKIYEKETYGVTHLITYSNMQPTEPLLRTDFLDYISFNAYSYSVWCWYRGEKGSVTGSDYQGFIEWLRAKFPDKPLVFSEFGISTAPGIKREGPPNYSYGGCTEDDQADGFSRMWRDMMTANRPVAGAIVFQYHDFWGHGWSDEPKEIDKKYHDEKDAEEWFGIVGIYGTSPQDYKVVKKKAFFTLQKLFK